MLVFIILCVLCGNGNHVSGSGSEYYYINITLCVLEVTGLARLAVSRSLMRPGRGHFFLVAPRLVSVRSRNTGADCTLANFFANISNIAAANIAAEGEGGGCIVRTHWLYSGKI